MNEGRDLHHIQFLKLLQGKSAADFRAAIAADPSRLPSRVQYAGGPNAHLPGSQASATVNLTEGDYVLMCWIPDKNGVPHVALGMQKALFVRGGKPTKVSGAKAPITIAQIDYQFILSKRIEAGLHTIRSPKPWRAAHTELVVVKLAPGATVQDAIALLRAGRLRAPSG